jgi:hypothetical protein
MSLDQFCFSSVAVTAVTAVTPLRLGFGGFSGLGGRPGILPRLAFPGGAFPPGHRFGHVAKTSPVPLRRS